MCDGNAAAASVLVDCTSSSSPWMTAFFKYLNKIQGIEGITETAELSSGCVFFYRISHLRAYTKPIFNNLIRKYI